MTEEEHIKTYDWADCTLGCMKRCEGRFFFTIDLVISAANIYLILFKELPEIHYIVNYAGTLFALAMIMSMTRSLYCFKYSSVYSSVYVQPTTRYCDKCGAYTHANSHHCSICCKCVVGMDHHCQFLNGCVARDNTVFFLSYLLNSVAILLVGICMFSCRLYKLLAYYVSCSCRKLAGM